MNETTKLLFALQQTENIIKLMQGNEYERFFSSHLSPIIYELNRQLTNQTESVKINNDA
tara:strand:- start:1731 stop:1907 length:177 start_codon:yes stop_codon:yes gene_type:complete